jgi:hypothetical protein
MIKRISLQSDDELQTLEQHLAGALRRVQPPIEIVNRLRERIHFPNRSDLAYQLADWRRLFFVFSGVMSGLLAAITIARAFFYFFGRREI